MVFPRLFLRWVWFATLKCKTVDSVINRLFVESLKTNLRFIYVIIDEVTSKFKIFYFTSEGKRKCFDLVTRKSYRNGEIWIRGDFACTACVCKRNGQFSCWAIQCNIPGCKDPARVEGRCCKFCMDTDWNKG